MALLCCAAALLLTLPTPGHAAFSTTPAPPSMTFSTGTLAAPAGVGAANGVCVPLTSRQITLTWTATSSTFADGYEIFRATTSGGPYTSIGTVNGQATVAYTDTSPAASTTYHFVVKAKKLAWRSGNSNQASVTTPGSLCV